MRTAASNKFQNVQNGALGTRKRPLVLRPYSDFWLCDIGTGDGIVQTQRAEYPAAGITKRVKAMPASAAGSAAQTDRLEIDVPRLNSLLAGKGDPENPARETALSTFNSETIGPTVQGSTSRRPNAVDRQRPPLPPLTTKTANMFRTAPLWGVRTRPQLLHDGRALTVDDAVKAHQGIALRHLLGRHWWLRCATAAGVVRRRTVEGFTCLHSTPQIPWRSSH